MSKSVLIIAGEASGDLHGHNLVKAIRRIDSKIEFIGIGGKRMENVGVKLVTSSSEIAVVGFTEIFTKIFNIITAGIKIKKILKYNKPNLVILIDYPDFNLHIAGYAKKIGIPVMYYISPQIWAWRRGRVNKIKKRVDRMVVILPFEKDFYKNSGVKVDYVGHPVIDEIPKSIDKKKIKKYLDAEGYFPILGILPGSRKEEIKNILPVMLNALDILRKDYKKIKSYLPLADTIDRGYVEKFIKDSSLVNIVSNKDIYNVLSICDLAFVTSGTATLETAIMEVPMVVAYKGSFLSFLIAKSLVKVSYISLVNLIAGRRVVPELIQNELTSKNLVKEALKIINNGELKENIKVGLRKVRSSLGEGGASEKAAKIAIEMIR